MFFQDDMGLYHSKVPDYKETRTQNSNHFVYYISLQNPYSKIHVFSNYYE